MALDKTTFQNLFEAPFNAFCSLNQDGTPKLDAEGLPVPSVGDYASAFASSYHAYSLTGQVLGAEHGTEQPAIIQSFMSAGVHSITGFAQALANYWATVLLTPGIPSHGGLAVALVTNDAAAQASAFMSALSATITDTRVTPLFDTFLSNIESIALPAITWYVTETFPMGVTAVFPEKVF